MDGGGLHGAAGRVDGRLLDRPSKGLPGGRQDRLRYDRQPQEAVGAGGVGRCPSNCPHPPILPMKTRVPKSYREMPGQRIGADLHAFSSESFAPSGRLQLAISCIFRQFVAPKFQTSGYRHRFATPDPPKAVARIRYQLQKRPPFGVAVRLPCVDRLMDYSSDLRRKP